MLEVYLKDRKFDFEFFEFSNNGIQYTVKNYDDVDAQTKKIISKFE